MKLAKLLNHAIELHGVFAMLYECTYTPQNEAIVYVKCDGDLIGHYTFDERKQPVYTALTQ